MHCRRSRLRRGDRGPRRALTATGDEQRDFKPRETSRVRFGANPLGGEEDVEARARPEVDHRLARPLGEVEEVADAGERLEECACLARLALSALARARHCAPRRA